MHLFKLHAEKSGANHDLQTPDHSIQSIRSCVAPRHDTAFIRLEHLSSMLARRTGHLRAPAVVRGLPRSDCCSVNTLERRPRVVACRPCAATRASIPPNCNSDLQQHHMLVHAALPFLPLKLTMLTQWMSWDVSSECYRAQLLRLPILDEAEGQAPGNSGSCWCSCCLSREQT